MICAWVYSNTIIKGVVDGAVGAFYKRRRLSTLPVLRGICAWVGAGLLAVHHTWACMERQATGVLFKEVLRSRQEPTTTNETVRGNSG